MSSRLAPFFWRGELLRAILTPFAGMKFYGVRGKYYMIIHHIFKAFLVLMPSMKRRNQSTLSDLRRNQIPQFRGLSDTRLVLVHCITHTAWLITNIKTLSPSVLSCLRQTEGKLKSTAPAGPSSIRQHAREECWVINDKNNMWTNEGCTEHAALISLWFLFAFGTEGYVKWPREKNTSQCGLGQQRDGSEVCAV